MDTHGWVRTSAMNAKKFHDAGMSMGRGVCRSNKIDMRIVELFKKANSKTTYRWFSM